MNWFVNSPAAGLPNLKPVAMPGTLRAFFLIVLCSLPAMASPYMPLGLVLRPAWMAVALLTPLVILIVWGRSQAGLLGRLVWQWCLPWSIFLGAYLLATLWHQKAFGLVSIQLSRLIMGALVYAAARLIGLRWAQLKWGVWIACFAYGVLACWEWWSALSLTGAASFNEAFAQHLTGFRVSLKANPIALGNQLIWLTGIVVLSQLLNTKQTPRDTALAVSAACCAMLACLLTFSRGPLLALLVLVILVIAFASAKRRFQIGLTTIITLAFLAVALVAFAPENRLAAALKALMNITNGSAKFDEPMTQRFQMWSLAIEGALRWPLMGPGTTGVGELFVSLNGPQVQMPSVGVFNHFHSDWLQPVVMGGAVLAFGQFATFGWLIRRSWGNPVLLWIVLAPLAFGLTDRAIHENNLFSFFTAILALYTAVFDNETQRASSPNIRI